MPGKATTKSGNPAQFTPWQRLRFITAEIGLILNLLMEGDTLRPGVATPELIGLLLGYLQEVADLRARGHLDASVALPEDAVSWQDYRAVLERLRRVMPNMEQQLRNDRARLAHEQQQLTRAADWTSTAKLTR